MRYAAVLLAFSTAAGGAAHPSPPTSAYTRVDFDRCKIEEHQEEGAYYLWRCTGYAGVPLFVETGDDRFDVDAGHSEDRDSRFSPYFDSPPDTIEWRLDKGRPFAIVYRLTSANPDMPRTSTVVVETIGSRRKPGCRIAEIPGRTIRANELARRKADELLRGKVRCLQGLR